MLVPVKKQANILEAVSLKSWSAPQKNADKMGMPNMPDPFFHPYLCLSNKKWMLLKWNLVKINLKFLRFHGQVVQFRTKLF